MVFILGYGIFRNSGIWDIGIYFGIQVKLILGYGIYWTVYFGIWDIAYPLTKPHNCQNGVALPMCFPGQDSGRVFSEGEVM